MKHVLCWPLFQRTSIPAVLVVTRLSFAKIPTLTYRIHPECGLVFQTLDSHFYLLHRMTIGVSNLHPIHCIYDELVS